MEAIRPMGRVDLLLQLKLPGKALKNIQRILSERLQIPIRLTIKINSHQLNIKLRWQHARDQSQVLCSLKLSAYNLDFTKNVRGYRRED